MPRKRNVSTCYTWNRKVNVVLMPNVLNVNIINVFSEIKTTQQKEQNNSLNNLAFIQVFK